MFVYNANFFCLFFHQGGPLSIFSWLTLYNSNLFFRKIKTNDLLKTPSEVEILFFDCLIRLIHQQLMSSKLVNTIFNVQICRPIQQICVILNRKTQRLMQRTFRG